MSFSMEQSPYGSRRLEEQELHLREWTMRAQISRENTRSRRFSGSHIRSFRESFRSSKKLTHLHTPSPLLSKHCKQGQGVITVGTATHQMVLLYIPSGMKQRSTYVTHFQEKYQWKDKMEGMTRDVGTQSTPHDLSSSSPSPTSTPSIIERSLKRCEAEAEDSPNCNQNSKTEDQNLAKETKEKEETTKVDSIGKVERKQKGDEQMRSCISIISCRQGGCLSWMRKRQREKHKPRKKSSFLPSLKGC
ncbi:hypothetical protein Tsubulata_019370 [Turnera subulata]|uniref:Uncharacterized protein n=1 Tax=Turnera subulata TaxID=218843 RepID=A0A9Q0GHT6_9ROSI|nr:hypothetical protein Tsubulata_019370 [Turnera subulata]